MAKRSPEAQAAQAALEADVKRNLNRIKRFVRSAEKRGYTFPENVVPTLPKSGITPGTLRKLEKITPANLYKKASYELPTGKRVKGTTRRKQERKESAQRAAVTRRGRQVLKTIRRMIDMWAPNPKWTKPLADLKESDKNRLQSILDGAIAELGENVVAKNLEDKANEVIELVDAIIYGESGDSYVKGGRDRANQKIAQFAAIIRNKPLTVGEAQDMSDDFDEDYEDEDELPL